MGTVVSATAAGFETTTDLCAADDQMSLAEAVIGLKAYKEVDERMVQLWHNLDTAIMGPRMNLTARSLPSIKQNNVSHEISLITGVC